MMGATSEIREVSLASGGRLALHRRLAAIVGFVLLFNGSATADPDIDALSKFGLLGSWAVDCTNPPSTANPHLAFAPSQSGYPTRTLRMGGFSETMEMRNARIIAPDRLAYFDAGLSPKSSFNVILAKVGERFRSYESIRTDGTHLIKEGKSVSSGNPTMVFQRCLHEVSAHGVLGTVELAVLPAVNTASTRPKVI